MPVAKASPRSGTSWMITYGDMVTLLLTFFVLVFVMLNEAESNIYRMIDTLLSETEEKLHEYVRVNKLDKSIKVKRGTKGVQLTIYGKSFFDVNSAEINLQLRPVIYNIAGTVKQSRLLSIESDEVLKVFYNSLRKNNQELTIEIRVEGHTDDWPIRGGKYTSNWELSSARALEVVKYLSEVSGISESKFSALGYGEYRPLATNETEEGRSLNRRVEIFIDADIVRSEDITS